MYATDFEYDGRLLSDFGFMICDFGNSSNEQVSTGGTLTFNKVSTDRGRKFRLTSTQYEECITATFSICKIDCGGTCMEVSSEEFREISRWLNRHTFHKLRFINDDYEHCYYEASFNISKITVGGVLYGMELTMETNRPFGFGEPVHKVFNMPGGIEFVFDDISDEIGFIYPNVKITCTEKTENSFNFWLENLTTGTDMVFKNCVAGEVIEVDGNTHSVTTSVKEHDIYNDFNYDYLKIGNSIDNRNNILVASHYCIVELTYTPVIKDMP